jgi:hypothetical protein
MDPLEKVAAYLICGMAVLVAALIGISAYESSQTRKMRDQRPGYCEKCGRWDGQPIPAEKR